MPHILIKQDMDSYNNNKRQIDEDLKRDEIISEIAKKYKVSRKTAEIRINNLEPLLKTKGSV